jgi:hypothetical protein
MKRPAVVTALAILNFIAFVCSFIGAALCFWVAATNPGARPVMVVGVFFAIGGVLELACGLGLWNLKPYGRILQLVFAVIGLLAIPIGTVVSILVLIYLFKPGVKILFSGRPEADLTAEDRAQIAAASGSGLAIAIVVLAFVAIGGTFVMLSLVSAIAVPGLLRARMSGNEASEIASLMAINSAQVSFASSCGNGSYATSLVDLAKAPPGTSTGFVSDDLARDPAIKSGYEIRLTGGPRVPNATACTGVPVTSSYFAGAAPASFGTTGSRSFGTNAEMTIFSMGASVMPTTLEGMPQGAVAIR